MEAVEKKTQNQEILEYLRQGYSLTAIQALHLFGCFRLAARCADLIRAGNIIISEHVQKGRTRYARYYIPKSELINQKS
jgi:hypothetical protein